MRTGLRRRMRWLIPAWFAIAVLGAPAVVAADANVAPSVTATASNANPVEPQTVVASATFTDPESDVETYTCSIDYGDGELFATGVISGTTCTGPAHRYLVTGSYVVLVFVTDSGGAGGVGMTAVNFLNRAPYVVGLGLVGYHQVGRAGHAVTAVEDNGSDVETYTCTSIDYGDGTPLQAGTWVPTGWSDGLPRCVFPDHVYATSGDYALTAVVTDSGGASGSAMFIETISPADPANRAPTVSAFMSDYNPREWHADPSVSSAVTASATFTDPESGSETYTCAVDYGDGPVVAGVVSGLTCTGPTHQYLVSGTYSVKVTVTDSGGASGTGTSGATYENWAPWVGGGLVGSFVVGSPVQDVAIVDDPGVAFETYTCTVDYGDGSGVQPGTYVPNGWSDGLPRCVGPDHIYNAPGSYSIVTTATDSAGETGSSLVIETIIPGVAPEVAISAPDEVNEGSSVAVSAGITPVLGDDTYTCTVDYGDGTGPQAGVVSGSICHGQDHVYGRPGNFTISVVVTSLLSPRAEASRAILVWNVAPTLTSYSISPGFAKMGSVVTASISYADPGNAETYTVMWDWGDGTSTTVELGSAVRSASSKHVYAKAGVYTLSMMLSDGPATDWPAWGDVGIYDPARTFSGSGSLVAPAGACLLSARCSAASRAIFSVSARYAKGATKPNVCLAYSATAFSFTATGADWYAATKGIATIQGTGKVNGVAGYTFRLVAYVGRPDTLELKVWDSAGDLVYDLEPAPLRTGSITIR